MNKFVTTLFLVVLTGNVWATAQRGDILVYEGENHKIFSNPLELYFDAQHPKPSMLKYSCSSIWRGYVATWKIEEEYLYLIKLVEGSCGEDAPEIPITAIFPKQQLPIKATWFSGILRVPLGEILHYVHMGYASIYEKDVYLAIEDGKLVSKKLVDNSSQKNKPPIPPKIKWRPMFDDPK